MPTVSKKIGIASASKEEMDRILDDPKEIKKVSRRERDIIWDIIRSGSEWAKKTSGMLDKRTIKELELLHRQQKVDSESLQSYPQIMKGMRPQEKDFLLELMRKQK